MTNSAKRRTNRATRGLATKLIHFGVDRWHPSPWSHPFVADAVGRNLTTWSGCNRY